MAKQLTPTIRLFYSYCHKDACYKAAMEAALARLKRDGLLQSWSDQEILPGQSISSEVRAKMDEANIIVFLFSPDFIASTECMKEWDYAKTLADRGKPLFRIPVIVRPCAWLDVLKGDDIKALPNDGNPVSSYSDADTAWLEVYEGIKSVVNQLRATFTPKVDYLEEIGKMELPSLDHVDLEELFVFLRLTDVDPTRFGLMQPDNTVLNPEQLLSTKRTLIFGPEKSGKTALARHLYISLVQESKPVLLMDLGAVNSRPNDRMFRDAYLSQFHGDYDLWVKQSSKTLILDNLNSRRFSLDLIDFAKDKFDNIIVTVASDTFHAFFTNESRLAEFGQFRIEQLTRQQQEELIRKRLALSESVSLPKDGLVDRAEEHVNSVIVSDRILPRYPFYVLSILQTYEGYMPTNMSITTYGHCYYVLIVARLMQAGISKKDDAINACFNFAEHLAFDIYQHRARSTKATYDFGSFIGRYQKRFIEDGVINRLRNASNGIISDDGEFRTDYMYYYFLGRFLAYNQDVGEPIIRKMCEDSHREANYLTLLFTIHHKSDSSIVDDLLLHTMCILDSVKPATLDRDETKRFNNIVLALPENILSTESVEYERAQERATQDVIDSSRVADEGSVGDTFEYDEVNAIFKMLRNNKIIGQILRNKYGNLELSKVKEAIETVVDGGLRLVNHSLGSEAEISEAAHFIKAQHPDWDTEQVKRYLELFSFLWTILNIEEIVNGINVPAIGEAVDEVVTERGTPAYDLVGFFNQLNRANQLTRQERDRLAALLKRHDDIFVRRILSIRIQHYMNTHRSDVRIEQSICSLLDIRYRQQRVVRAP